MATKWFLAAQKFVEERFPDRETEIRVVPPLRDVPVDVQLTLVSTFYEIVRKRGESMFIVCSRDIKQLLRARLHGGLYGISENDKGFDVVVIDRHRGLFYMKCGGNVEKKRGDSGKKDCDELKALMMEAGMDDKKQVDDCLSFPVPIPLFCNDIPLYKGPTDVRPLVLIDDHFSSSSLEVLGDWWEKIIEHSETKKIDLKPEIHKALLAIFVAPFYVSPSSKTGETNVNFLKDRELEILIHEPAKSVIKGNSETERMKFMMEKVRNIVTKWFSKRPITETERILVLGARHDIRENLNSMLEWIVSSAIGAYSTWTTMSAKEMRRRIQNLINKNLVFCTFFPDKAYGEVPTIEEPMHACTFGIDMPKVKAIVGRLYEGMGGTTEHPGTHEWQEIRRSYTNFHHIFVLGAHKFNLNLSDICKLHLSKHGYFWLLWPEGDLPDTFVAELIHSGFIRPDRKSIQVTSMGRGSPPARETTWLYQAENFIRRTYPDWRAGNTTHLFPPVQYKDEWIKSARTRRGRAERSLILRLHELGQRKRSPIFITYNSDFAHLIKTRNVGGGIEGILESEGHDIVLIHHNFGVILIQIKNLNAEKTEKEVGDAATNNQTAAEQLEMDVRSVTTTRKKLEDAMRECGLEDINVSLSVIAIPTVKREWVDEGPTGAGLVFLCEEDCSSAKSLEEWWQKYILQSEHLQSSTIKDETYISLLAIYIAPVYATPAFTARFNRQNLSFLTEEKLDILVNGPKEFVLKGAAGTGKTWIVQEKIRNIVMSWFSRGPIEDKDETILLIRRNTQVANELRRTLYDLLLTSAMAMISKWVDGTNDEEERQKNLSESDQHVILETLHEVFKTQKPPFDHMFVDDGEEWCKSYGDHWMTMLRSLHKGSGGYFWRTYDPLSDAMEKLTNAMKSEVKGARPLYTVLRNTGSVLETWTRAYTSPVGGALSTNTIALGLMYEIGKIQLGHNIRGPKVEMFHVSSSDLAEKIQGILEEKFPHANQLNDIAIVFADEADFQVHMQRLTVELCTKQNECPEKRYNITTYADFFKGLEAPIVFLIINSRQEREMNLYMGATRSTSHLFVLSFEGGAEEEEAALEILVNKLLRFVFLEEMTAEVEDAARKETRRRLVLYIPNKFFASVFRNEADEAPKLEDVTSAPIADISNDKEEIKQDREDKRGKDREDKR
ncbi:unnamed protein product [Darwinula stevensoni]|uniref:Uncharacterized protein n=1 Tax=Darwinula stevensoni TaxID=69355 RepID=A0A7R9A5D4_9CRUS|nr:unnamed protein product [Darwinula stevensoni]CAG0885099.1 unnamed protein product [Darwinula stevensoni]